MGVQIDAAAAATWLRRSQRQLHFLHISPDGDSIGSTLALVRAMRAVGHEAWAVGVDPVPRVYRFLEGWDTLFVPWEKLGGEWDLAVFLDCGDLDRVGAAVSLVGRCAVTLNVDHHATNSLYGEYNYIDYTAAACGEQVFHLLKEMGVPIDAPTAAAVYTALVTDTGRFCYESVTAETHRIAAELVAAGVRPYDISQRIFENESPSRVRLLAGALGTLRLRVGGRLASLTVTGEMLAAAGAEPEDVDGLVNHARAVSGVEVAVLFRAAEPGVIRVNLRSRGRVDVAQLAQALGGGGHARAAGCTLQGSLAEVEGRVVALVAAALEA